MARFSSVVLLAASTLVASQSTEVYITEGLTTTLTLPAFPSGGSTVVETSTVVVPTTVANTTAVVAPLPTEVNTSAQSSYISSLLGSITNTTATTTVVATSVVGTTSFVTLPTGTGGGIYLPTNTTGVPPAEYTGAAVKSLGGLSALSLVVFGVAALVL